ncbi:MAG: magnesium transporter [Opitutales bacterium]|jgi:magnesium transporter|nr:magnesium transporter [Opitutales bacterium]MDG2254780.1 magnesium transporter [Opitutaceae bacterium]MBT5167362.1 magnesium transporter [Opitutales bacterium]MBT5815435.1 magnesium transporter [Opitutales bacterium]MBT6379703.1 magnesium transporter [Opitutales bacterium]
MQEREMQNPTESEAYALRRARLVQMHPSDIAAEIENLELDEIREVFRDLNDDKTADVIPELPQELQTELMENMRLERVTEIIPEMLSDEAADALGDVSPERLHDIMEKLPSEEYEEISDLMEYPEDSAGGIMQKEVHAIKDSLTLAEAREAIRKDEDQDQEDVSSIYVYAIDDSQRLKGVLRLRDLLFRDLRLLVSKVMVTEVRSISVNADQEEIANLFQKYNYSSLPVVDDFGKLVGRVTSDDVLDVIQEEATEDMQRMVGISGDESVSTPWRRSVRNRLPWLCVNLCTGFGIAWVVSMFEPAIEQYAILAFFLPIVGLLGGNAGNQTLTIVVRSLALGEIDDDEWKPLLLKEVITSFTTGFAIGTLAGLASWLWIGMPILGLVVFLAMLLNMIAAALAGVLVPFGLRSLKIDPALASSIMVTTATDVIGFFIFLSLATLAINTFSL